MFLPHKTRFWRKRIHLQRNRLRYIYVQAQTTIYIRHFIFNQFFYLFFLKIQIFFAFIIAFFPIHNRNMNRRLTRPNLRRNGIKDSSAIRYYIIQTCLTIVIFPNRICPYQTCITAFSQRFMRFVKPKSTKIRKFIHVRIGGIEEIQVFCTKFCKHFATRLVRRISHNHICGYPISGCATWVNQGIKALNMLVKVI